MLTPPFHNVKTGREAERAGLIDTHAHLDFPDFDNDRDQVLKHAKAGGVEAIINVSSSLKGCRAALDLAKRYESVYATIGIHPHDCQDVNQDTFTAIESFVASPKVVAIGEVGLDFYRNLSPADIQKETFSRFIKLSLSAGLPLIIHSRQAERDTLEILKKNTKGSLNGVVHCFSGSPAFLEDCLRLGLYISFTCNITYKKSGELRQLVRSIPLERLLLETDCPYLAPEGMRGKRNEPANVKILAGKIAELRNCGIEEIALATTENAKRLFGINR